MTFVHAQVNMAFPDLGISWSKNPTGVVILLPWRWINNCFLQSMTRKVIIFYIKYMFFSSFFTSYAE